MFGYFNKSLGLGAVLWSVCVNRQDSVVLKVDNNRDTQRETCTGHIHSFSWFLWFVFCTSIYNWLEIQIDNIYCGFLCLFVEYKRFCRCLMF